MGQLLGTLFLAGVRISILQDEMLYQITVASHLAVVKFQSAQ